MPIPPQKPLRVPTILDVIPYSGHDVPSRIACPSCGDRLSLHQPDPELPEALVGVCGKCRRWRLIRVDLESSVLMILLLPDREWFEAISRAEDRPDRPPRPTP